MKDSHIKRPSIPNHSKVDILNEEALHLETIGKHKESLELLDQLLNTSHLDPQVHKGFLERATYLCVLLKDYQKAGTYQQQLVGLCEGIYLRADSLPHPLLGFHYYQLGKLQSQSFKYVMASENLSKAAKILGSYYSHRSKTDG
jgi:tetratricopeptide (TPR) repeat protein